jgi:hypothetical protein
MVKQYENSFLLGFDTFTGTVTALDPNREGTAQFDLNDAIVGSAEYFCHKVCFVFLFFCFFFLLCNSPNC